MALTVGSDSYVTLTEAAAYLGRRLRTSAWDSADTPTREKALKHATIVLEGLPWAGDKDDAEQTLAFPRDGDDVPQAIKDAQIETALWLLTFDSEAIAHLAHAGVIRHGVGPVQMDLSRIGGYHALPPIVQGLLADYVALGVRLTR